MRVWHESRSQDLRWTPTNDEVQMILAIEYRARHASGFGAYMALQAALLRRHIARGGSVQSWCARLAPAFQQRYGAELLTPGQTIQ